MRIPNAALTSAVLREGAAGLRNGTITADTQEGFLLDMERAADLIDRAADEWAIVDFSVVMAEKMTRARAKGRTGWQDLPPSALWPMLKQHVEKGDPVDVAIFAMMIHANTEAAGPHPGAPGCGSRLDTTEPIEPADQGTPTP